MIIEIIFQKPEELYVDNAYDGKKILFMYSIKYLVEVPEFDKIEQKKVIVSISDISLRRWNYKDDYELFKVLFIHVFELIKKKLVSGELNEIEKLDIKVSYEDKEKRYDPNKILDFINVPRQLDLDKLRKESNNIKLGF